MTFNKDMNIIIKNINKTWKTIYEAIYEIYFEKSEILTDEFLEPCVKI